PGEPIVFAGLLERDMRAYGGHLVSGLVDLASYMRHTPVRILHAGGELLGCSAWEAALMLLPLPQAREIFVRYGEDVQAREHWAHTFLGRADHAPYLLARSLFPQTRRLVYNAVGGVDLAAREPAMRAEVVEKLAQADMLTVRDRHTRAGLHAAGVAADLVPDPAVMVAALFGTRIDQHAGNGEVAQLRAKLPQGYLAVQFSADFGREEILKAMARQWERIAAAQRCGIVLFRAGAAPWHDDLEIYRQLAAHIHTVPVIIFQSLDVWDICAVIAHSRAYCGSSLHGRIVALAFHRPRMNLRHPDQPHSLPSKQEAFVQTWEDSAMPGVAAIEEIESGLHIALQADPPRLRDKSDELSATYRKAFEAIRAQLLSSHQH
ncbi:MAG: polysaccharide pyruvyl transferase family protein, partial [Burkholderiaceae bacterium]